jgi:hypothetical protein
MNLGQGRIAAARWKWIAAELIDNLSAQVSRGRLYGPEKARGAHDGQQLQSTP